MFFSFLAVHRCLVWMAGHGPDSGGKASPRRKKRPGGKAAGFLACGSMRLARLPEKSSGIMGKTLPAYSDEIARDLPPFPYYPQPHALFGGFWRRHRLQMDRQLS